MSTITKEWLQHAINDYENCRNEPLSVLVIIKRKFLWRCVSRWHRSPRRLLATSTLNTLSS